MENIKTNILIVTYMLHDQGLMAVALRPLCYRPVLHEDFKPRHTYWVLYTQLSIIMYQTA